MGKAEGRDVGEKEGDLRSSFVEGTEWRRIDGFPPDGWGFDYFLGTPASFTCLGPEPRYPQCGPGLLEWSTGPTCSLIGLTEALFSLTELGRSVTRDPPPTNPPVCVSVWVLRHSPSHTYNASVAKSFSKEGKWGPEREKDTHTEGERLRAKHIQTDRLSEAAWSRLSKSNPLKKSIETLST